MTQEEFCNRINDKIHEHFREYNDGYDSVMSEQALKAMERAFCGTLGSEILKRGVKVIKGQILPHRKYGEGFYEWRGNNLFADAIIEYPDGRRHTLTKTL